MNRRISAGGTTPSTPPGWRHPGRRALLVGRTYNQGLAEWLPVPFEHLAVYLDADAGSLWHGHLPVLHGDRAVYKVFAEGMRRGVELEHRLFRVERDRRGRQRGDELQRGREPDARSPDVRDHGGVPRLGYGRDLLALGKSSRRA